MQPTRKLLICIVKNIHYISHFAMSQPTSSMVFLEVIDRS